MRSYFLTSVVVLACGVIAVGQTRGWTPQRLADGQIDIEGVWDFSTITPLERPSGLTKDTFTDAEAAAFEREENLRQNRELIDPKKGSTQYLAGQRHPLQRVLVRARQQDRRHQAHIAHHRSA
jgi:hypothetical protein